MLFRSENVTYVDGSVGCFDYCSTKTWSLSVLDQILEEHNVVIEPRMHVYWCRPRNEIDDGLVPIETESDMAMMTNAVTYEKTLVLFIDHTNFLRNLRADIIINGGPSLPHVISPIKSPAPAAGQREDSMIVSVAEKNDVEFQSQKYSESDDSDCDFYDSDTNAEEGDVDLFLTMLTLK